MSFLRCAPQFLSAIVLQLLEITVPRRGSPKRCPLILFRWTDPPPQKSLKKRKKVFKHSPGAYPMDPGHPDHGSD